MLNIDTVLCGQYRIEKQIGQGGMSKVYLAQDQANGRRCAVKVVDRSGVDSNNAVVVQSLAMEAGMLKALSNPYLPQIYDIMETPDSFTMVMEYIEGESLDRVLFRSGPQNVEDVIGWGQQICSVFDYLHNQPSPIIYRDMKPANVMLQPDGKIKLIDFGTARTQKLGVSMNSDTVMIGTEGFAAPEQYGGMGQSDARTDIYCLGATMYNLLTGCQPNRTILMSINVNEGLRETPLAAVLTRCLQTDPDLRYQTVMEVYQDLQHVLDTGNRRNTGWIKRSRGNAPGGSWQMGNSLSGLLKGGGSAALKKQEPVGEWNTVQQPGAAAPAAGQADSTAADQPAGRPPRSGFLTERLRQLTSGLHNGAHANAESPGEYSQQDQEYAQAEPDQSMWRSLLLVSMAAAVIFAGLAIFSALQNQTALAVLSVCIAAGGVGSGAYCALRCRGG